MGCPKLEWRPVPLVPQRTPVLDVLASVFTSLKWVFVGRSFILLLIGVAARVRRLA